MEYNCQFDPLQPDKPAELTCDGKVIATTTLNNAQALANKLNAYDDLYEAWKETWDDINKYGDGNEDKIPAWLALDLMKGKEAIAKAETPA